MTCAHIVMIKSCNSSQRGQLSEFKTPSFSDSSALTSQVNIAYVTDVESRETQQRNCSPESEKQQQPQEEFRWRSSKREVKKVESSVGSCQLALVVSEEVGVPMLWPPPPGSSRRSLELLPSAFIRLGANVMQALTARTWFFFSFFFFFTTNTISFWSLDDEFISIQIVNLFTSHSWHVQWTQWTSQIAVILMFLFPLAGSCSWSDCFSFVPVTSEVLKDPPACLWSRCWVAGWL